MMPGIAPVIGGAQAGTFITAETWSSGGDISSGYEAGSRGTLQAGGADPWAQYLQSCITIDVGGGTIALIVGLSGDRLGLVSGKKIYVDGTVVPENTADYPWMYDSQAGATFREWLPIPFPIFANGVTYRIEIK